MEPTPPAQSLTGPVHDLILRVDSAIASEPEFESSRGVEAAANSFSLLPYLVMDHPIQCRDRAGARSNLSLARRGVRLGVGQLYRRRPPNQSPRLAAAHLARLNFSNQLVGLFKDVDLLIIPTSPPPCQRL